MGTDLKGNSFEVLEGKTTVLISAPHAYDHKRPSLTCPLKQAEPWTDTLARSIASESGSLGIVQRGVCGYDPNYHREEQNPYKKRLRSLAKKKKIAYILDLHGLSDQYPLDIAIYYPVRYRKSRQIADELATYLNKGKLRGLSIHLYNFGSPFQETISEFSAQELQLPSVQIEIARYIREDPDLRDELAGNITAFISSFS